VLDDLGLGPAISWYAETVMAERQRATAVTVDVPGERLPRHLEVALFRIAQEALNNVAKHADAATATITIRRDTDIILVIEDDGVGFDIETVANADRASGGVGLAGMQERAALLGGTMTITSTVGHGARLHVQVPLTEPEADR
jgi:signal transduction histidine kinase